MKEFEKVIGYESVKAELYRIVDMIQNSEKYKKLGVKTTRGLLLEGEPGVGKTLMVKCLINACKRPTFTIRKDEPDGDFVKSIKDKFEKAKDCAPSIVFLDDVDKFANEDYHHRNAEEFVTIQSCIDDCKDDEVFVIATANELHCLPESLLREGRFDKEIKVKNPTGKDAEEIVQYYLSLKKVSKDVNYKEVTRFLDGRSCASLETVINEAGVYAGYDNKELIEMSDIVKAFMRVVYKAPESVDFQDSKYLRNTAVHEAGHVLVGEVLQPGSVNIASVKRHLGDIGGFTSFYRDEDYFESMHFMENRVISLLAGKAATEITYGVPDVGVEDDVDRARNITSRFAIEYCAYGFDCLPYEPLLKSPDTMSNTNKVVQKQLGHYYAIAKKIIIENREALDKLADALVEKKTIDFNDIQAIISTCNLKPYALC